MSIASDLYINSLRESGLSKEKQLQIFDYASSAKDYKLLTRLASYPGLDDAVDRKLGAHKSHDVRVAWLKSKERNATQIDTFIASSKSEDVIISTLRMHRKSLSDTTAQSVLDKTTKGGNLLEFITSVPSKRGIKISALRKLALYEPPFITTYTKKSAPDSAYFGMYLDALKRFPEIADELALSAKSPFLVAAASCVGGVSKEGKKRAVEMITRWYSEQVVQMGDKVDSFYKSIGYSPTSWLQDVLWKMSDEGGFDDESVLALTAQVLEHLKYITGCYQASQIHRSLKYAVEMRRGIKETIEFDWIRDCSNEASLSNTLDHVLESFKVPFESRQRVASIEQIVKHPLATRAIMAKAATGLPATEVGSLMHKFLRSDNAKLAAWLAGGKHLANHSVMDADDSEGLFELLLDKYCGEAVVLDYLVSCSFLTEESARKLDARVMLEKSEFYNNKSSVISNLLAHCLTTPAQWEKFELLIAGLEKNPTRIIRLGEVID